jgi:branched-chain amino acid transport system permease protein
MRPGRWWRVTGLAVAVVLLALLPLNSTPYTNYQIALVATYAVAILGLNLVSGYAGQISLGQSAFFGLGAYAAGIATVRGDWPLPASFLLACVLPAAVGLVVAIPAVQLRGHGLAIFTLALPLIGVALAKRFSGLTGGSEGLGARMSQAPAWTGLDTDQWTYYLVLAIAAALFLLARNMVTGRLGRALAVVRENEVVAVSMGISPRRYKALAFALAAAFGGAAGWLYAYTIGFVSPVEMDFLLSINLLAMMIIGGMGSVLGSFLGGVLYVYVPVVAGTVDPVRTTLLYGAILVAVLLFAPGGIARALRRAGVTVGSPATRT